MNNFVNGFMLKHTRNRSLNLARSPTITPRPNQASHPLMSRILVTSEHFAALARRVSFDPDGFASRLGISRRHLRRLFQANFAQSPKEWLDEQRIAAACEMLLEGHNIKFIAIELGFKQSSHFCRQFRCYKGLKPSQFATLAVAYAQCPREITNVLGR